MIGHRDQTRSADLYDVDGGGRCSKDKELALTIKEGLNTTGGRRARQASRFFYEISSLKTNGTCAIQILTSTPRATV